MDKYTFKLASFNYKGVKRSIDHIRELCRDIDIIALQETWLLPDDVSYLCSIDGDFSTTGKSGMNTAEGKVRGRPYGGVALLWRMTAFQNIGI